MAVNVNNLFEAIGTIAEGTVKKYQYDQTVEAKIVSTALKKEGKYRVDYSGQIFDAYAQEGASYYDKEVVYVHVPRGDFSKQKYIIGRKVDEDDGQSTTFNFKLPFDDFIPLENLTYNTIFTSKGYLANKPSDGSLTEADDNYLKALEKY